MKAYIWEGVLTIEGVAPQIYVEGPCVFVVRGGS